MNIKELIDKWNKEPIKIPKTGRNDLCPCGSGKKFKRCCWAAIFTKTEENRSAIKRCKI